MNPSHTVWARFTRDGQHLISSESDGHLTIRGGEEGSAVVHTLGEAAPRARPFALSPDSRKLAFASDSVLELWSIPDGHLLRSLPVLEEDEQAQALAFSPDGASLALATDLERVRVFDTRSGAATAQLPGGERNPTLFFHPTGSVLAHVACFPGSSAVQFHAFSEGRTGGEPAPALRSGFDAITGGCFSPAGTQVAFVDKYLKVYDFPSGRLAWTFTASGELAAAPEPGGLIESHGSNPLFTRDGSRVLYAAPQGTIYVFHLADGSKVRQLNAHEGRVYSLDLDPRETTLVSAGEDGRVIFTALD